MKKILLFASALAGLFLAGSCQRENLEPVAGNGTVTITVEAPGAMGTKAIIADGENVNEVHYAVYMQNDGNIYSINGGTSPLAQGVVEMKNKKATVTFDLLQDQEYSVIFWAQVKDAGHYTLGDLRQISINTNSVKGNDETRAAFFRRYDFSTDVHQDHPVTLYRPFSQLNLLTTKESLEPKSEGQITGYTIDVKKSQVVVTGLSTAFNTVDGVGVAPADATAEFTFAMNETPEEQKIQETLTVNGVDYHYVSMNYLFVPTDAENSALVGVKYVVETDKGNIDNDIINVPIRENYRTNIIGNLLTKTTEFTIIVDPIFEEPAIIVNYEKPAQNAENQYVIRSAENLYWLAAAVNGTLPADSKANLAPQTFAGQTFILASDIDLAGAEWTPIGNDASNRYTVNFRGTFDGRGHTIRNFTIDAAQSAGLFGNMVSGTVKNLTVSNFEIASNHYAGAVVAWAEQGGANIIVDNCKAENGKITLQVEQINGSYDNGDKAGAIVGFAYSGTYTNNVASNVTITGYRDLGGIAGYVKKTNISNNAVDESVTLVQNLANGYEASTPTTLGHIYGRNDGGITEEGNSGKSTIVKERTIYYINTVEDFKAFAAKVNAGETDEKTIAMLAADLDLNSEEWTPIGNSTYSFKGEFDGQNHTVSNLVVTQEGKSNVGLFGMTTIGEIRNLIVNNAKITGRLNVGVIAGTPYTSKYSNVKVTGHVEVNGMAYVGGVGGKNAYANWTNVTVDVDETSYVSANSVENGTAYRTYVGGVVGFNGEGGHSFTNITSNINVTGTTCDVGGLFGIAHYGNKFVNCSCSGNVEITAAAEAGDAEEMGGIAGVWNNGGSDVIFTDCSYTGTLTANITEGVDLSNNTIVGKAYSATGTGKLIINGSIWAENLASLKEALANGKDVALSSSVTVAKADAESNAYGSTGINQTNGGTIDGNNNSFGVDAWSTWDSAINTTGGTIRNITINSGMRGIFINHNGTNSSKVYLDNVTIDGTIYTISCDQGTNSGLEAVKSTFNGWTSYAATIGDVKFVDCSFGEGQGYAFCRPYAPTEFVGCAFEAGYEVDARAAVTFENCTLDGADLTAENLSTLVTSNISNATVK